jgi:hypothetical protein
MPWWRRPWHSLRVGAIWVKLVWDRIGIANGIDKDGVAHDSNFLPANSASIGEALSVRQLFEVCLAENERRMSGYDARLLRPVAMPRLVRLALRFIRK